MSSFIEAAAQRPSEPASDWLEEVREAGRKVWETRQFPSRKTEDWKYLNLRALERTDYATAPPATGAGKDLASLYDVPQLDAVRLVFVNGQFQEKLSDTELPEGVRMARFSDASESDAASIRASLGSIVDIDKHLFAALNDSWLADGVYLQIADDAEVARPIQVVWLTTPESDHFSVSQRLLVVAGRHSRADVIEHFASTDEPQTSFTNGVTELLVGPGARLRHYRLHLEQEDALHIGGVHTRLDRDATLESFHLGLGGKLKRIDAVVHHAGEGAHCEMNGIYLPRGSQQIDYHTTIEHAVPNCTTNETFRGIIADKAKAVFNGRIHIHPDAQKTRAELSNRNLLTSPDAEVDTKPELEIYADDVQCAHGATVAQLEEESLYYMVSRGIDRGQAEVMLSFGFINELVDRIRLEPLAEFIRPQLASLFGRDGALTRHLDAAAGDD